MRKTLSTILATTLAAGTLFACNNDTPVPGSFDDEDSAGDTEDEPIPDMPDDPEPEPLPDPKPPLPPGDCDGYASSTPSTMDLGLSGSRLHAPNRLSIGTHVYEGSVFQQRTAPNQVLQFDMTLSAQQIESARELGVHIQGPRGNHAYTVFFENDVDLSTLSATLGNDVTKAVNFAPSDKIEPVLVKYSPDTFTAIKYSDTQQEPWNLPWVDTQLNTMHQIVYFYDQVDDTTARDIIEWAGGTVESELLYKGEKLPGLNLYQISTDLDYSALSTTLLSELDEVMYIEHALVQPTHTNLKGRYLTNAARFQENNPGMTGSFMPLGNYDGGRGFDIAPVLGRIQFYDENETPSLHAMHTIGTTIGNGAESRPYIEQECSGGHPEDFCSFYQDENGELIDMFADYAGMGIAYEGFILSTGHDGCGQYCYYNDVQNLPDKFEWLIESGAISIGSSTGSNAAGNGFPCEINGDHDEASGRVIDHISKKEGVSVDYSAGNERGKWRCQNTEVYGDGHFYDLIGSPAAGCKNCIIVGAADIKEESLEKSIDEFDPMDLEFSFYTSVGPTDDGRRGPTVSTYGGGQNTGVISPLRDADGFVSHGAWMGTSMSRPHQQGVQHILTEYAMDLGYEEELLHVPSFWKALTVMATNPGSDAQYAAPNVTTGYGYVDALEGERVLEKRSYAVDEMQDGYTHVYELFVTPNGGRVTLAWDDPHSTPGSEKALVNDLDIRIIGAQHDYYPTSPNVEKPWCPEIPGRDNRDVVERIDIAPGEFQSNQTILLVVSGYEVNPDFYGKPTQTYSLISDMSMVKLENVPPNVPE